MNTIQNYIVVDDDPLSNKICRVNIKKAVGEVEIKTFTSPEEGLAFIEDEFIKNVKPTILFLDINMPTINGWKFLERYEKFSDEIKSQITIYMLSSSISPSDMEKAKANKHVTDFISKPLLIDIIGPLAGIKILKWLAPLLVSIIV